MHHIHINTDTHTRANSCAGQAGFSGGGGLEGERTAALGVSLRVSRSQNEGRGEVVVVAAGAARR